MVYLLLGVLLFLMAVILAILYPVETSTITVHGAIDFQNPIFVNMYDAEHTWVWLNATNNENKTQSFVVLLQLQDKEGYVTQLVETQQFTLRPFEENAVIVTAEYHNETGKRLLDIFVWTELDHPQPLSSYQYIVNMDDQGTFAETRISNDAAVMISQLLSACDDGEPSCDITYLEIVSRQCSDFAVFEVIESNSICNDQRLEQYRT